MPAPRRNVRSTPDGGSAVQPLGLSYTAHWEALGCALCLLTTPEISSTGPMWGRGFCPGSHRPSACVPLVVWAWDFLLCGFLAAVSRPLLAHCFLLCDLRLFVNKRMLLVFVRFLVLSLVCRPVLSEVTLPLYAKIMHTSWTMWPQIGGTALWENPEELPPNVLTGSVTACCV
jgi:hypothetical protein